MSGRAHHRMDCELIVERETVRYHCTACDRCVEDGPDGLRVLHRGDPHASHRGGSVSIEHEEIEQDRPEGPVWH